MWWGVHSYMSCRGWANLNKDKELEGQFAFSYFASDIYVKECKLLIRMERGRFLAAFVVIHGSCASRNHW